MRPTSPVFVTRRGVRKTGCHMRTVTKKDLIDAVATRAGVRKEQVRDVIQITLEQFIEELGNGNRIEFRDFGVFEVRSRAPRVAQNPKTLKRVEVPSKRTVKFKMGRLMRERLDTNGSTNGVPIADHPPQAVVQVVPNPKPERRRS